MTRCKTCGQAVTVAAYPARWLAHLPAPWRLRLRFGDVTIDCTSADLEPNGWCRTETWYVLIAALEDRIGPKEAEASARGRTRRAVTEPATWLQITGGLNERCAFETRGTVGAALAKIGAELVGEWSGDAAEVMGHGQGQGGPVRGVRTRKGRAAASVPPVR